MNNILITSAGRRVSLVREFQREIKSFFPDAKVFTVDLNPKFSSACQFSDGYFKVPKVINITYIDRLISICQRNDIGLIIPTIDTELLILAENKKKFRDYGIHLVISDKKFIEKCRDKRKIHIFFKEYNIPCATEMEKENLEFPVFVKPYNGSCSKGIQIINSKSEFNSHLFNNRELMFLEYLDPKSYDEFTIDLYYNKDSVLKCIVPRLRLETRGGEVSKGKTVKNFLLKYVYERLNNVKGLFGCITLQVFVNKNYDDVIGIEINPRFGGGYPLSYNAKANFPKMIIEEYLLKKTVRQFDDWEDNLLMLRYDDEILVRNVDK